MYTGPERREPAGDARIDRIEARLNEMETTLVKNTAMTADVHQIIGHGRSFFTVLGLIGNVVKWLAGIVVIVGGAWAIWTGKN